MDRILENLTAWLTAVGLMAPGAAFADIDLDIGEIFEGAEETFVVFPTYAAPQPDGDLVIPLRAWVFEPEEDSITRKAIISTMQTLLDIDDPEESEIFERRIRLFLVDNERGKTIDLTLDGEKLADGEERSRFTMGTSAANGHMKRRIRIPAELADEAVERTADGQPFLNVTFRADFGMEKEVKIPLLARSGVSIISDIDDTIKITGVTSRERMLRATFFEPFRVVDGMSELYNKLAGQKGAAFHYVSASPWQLMPFLTSLLQKNDFPIGSFHLRTLRPKSISSPRRFLGSSEEFKTDTIGQIIDDFPGRRFLLVGDSSEHDPEVYAEVAKHHPERVAGILIREVPGADNSDERFRKNFKGLPDALWHTAEEPGEVTPSEILSETE